MSAFAEHLPALLGQSVRGFLLMAAIFVPLEFAFARARIPLLRHQFWTDLGYYFFNGMVPALVLTAILGYVAHLVSPLYASGLYSWIAYIPVPVKFVLAIIVGDVGAYWGHRWSHEVPFLWYFHKIHHQAESIDWLVTSRAHPVDMIFLKFCGVMAIYLAGLAQGSLGQGTALMSIYVILGGLWAFFVHANINWRFGILEKYLATPAFHHWHHSNESPESIDKNYAAIFPFIDRYFGTYHLPSQRWPAYCGLRVSPAARPLAEHCSADPTLHCKPSDETDASLS
ncbi:MAG: sterol desaturase family protein [Cyanobium sp.]